MQYVVDNGGLTEEWGFGYQSFYGKEIACDMTGKRPVATIEGFTNVKSNDYLSLMNAVAFEGPGKYVFTFLIIHVC